MGEFQRARTLEQRDLRLAKLRLATRELLVEASPDDVTLRAIASRSDIAPSGVLRYAGSREELLLDVMDQEYQAWIAELGEMLDSPRSVDAIAETVAKTLVARRVLLELIAESPHLLRGLSPTTRALSQGLRNQTEMARVIDAALSADLRPEQAALLVAGLHAIVAGANGWSRQEVFVSTPESAIRELFAILLEGLRVRSAM